MQKLLRLALFWVLSPTLLFGSHVITSYAEFEIDSATNEISIEYHVILDSTGISFIQNTISAQGPINIVLLRDTVIPFLGKLGGPFCSGPIYYEVIFKVTGRPLWVPNGSGLITFDMCPPCCVSTSQNLVGNSKSCASITFGAQPDGQGDYYFPNVSTFGTSRNFIQEAYAGLSNLNDFGQNFIPGVDSIDFRLAGVPQGGGGIAAMFQGYSVITPLPDFSEDSLNGPNEFYPNLGVIKSLAIDSSFSEGNYSVGIERRTYNDGQVYTSDRSTFLVYYHHRDTSIAPFDLRVKTPDSSFRTNSATTHLSYNLAVGDSLELDITALGNVGDIMLLLSDTILEPLDTSELPAGTSYGLPKLISLNPGGGFVNLDSNSVRFSFVPTFDNIRYMRERNYYKLVFGQDSCRGDVHSVLIEVVFNQKPRILVLGEERDSLEICTLFDPRLEVFKPNNSFRWVPAALFSSATNHFTNVTAKVSRWYYLVNPLTAALLDSIYLDFIQVDTLHQLNVDTLASRLVLNDAKASQSQVWRIADMIEVENDMEDELPILGPGEYHVLSEFDRYECPHFSDTANISYNSKWASNYGKAQGVDSVVLDVLEDPRRQFSFKIQSNAGVKHISELYIKGLKDVSDDGSAWLTVHLNSNGGFNRIDTFTLKQATFLTIPVSETFLNTDRLEVTVDMRGKIMYHKLVVPNYSYYAGDFRYYHLRVGADGSNLLNATSTLPVGLKLANTIGLEEIPDTNVITLFPQPTSGMLQVIGSSIKGQSWTLKALNGSSLLQGTFSGNEAELDLSQLPAGLYLLAINEQVHKVVKE
ncbi:MAG: T9SS type A sorting domain-containing protein [Bacteroidetes bacterium]|nr:T9SS type A sorting domain-containing protein [Bacteroidota bacterium]